MNSSNLSSQSSSRSVINGWWLTGALGVPLAVLLVADWWQVRYQVHLISDGGFWLGYALWGLPALFCGLRGLARQRWHIALISAGVAGVLS